MNLTRACLSLPIVAAVLFSGCATTSTTSTSSHADPNVLRVGVAAELPPLIFKTGSEYKGLEADLARGLAENLGKSVEFVDVRWDSLIDDLLNDKMDIIMSGMTITQERLVRINFSKPYLRSGQTLLVRRTDAALIQMTLFEPKTRIGSQKGTTGDFWVKQNCFRNVRKQYSTAEQGAKAVAAKQIDAFVCDAPVNWWQASANESAGLTVVGGYLTEEYLGWGIRRGDPELLESANQFIDQIRKNGELQKMVKRWIPYQ